MASALASLTANYTDSEGEEDLSREEQEEAGDRLHPSLAERLGKLGDSPGSSGSAGSLVRQTNSQSGEDACDCSQVKKEGDSVINCEYYRYSHKESQTCVLH